MLPISLSQEFNFKIVETSLSLNIEVNQWSWRFILAMPPQGAVDSHADWSDREGFPFALLADTDHKVIESYGVRSAVVGVKRTVYIIDSQGIVQWRFTGGVRAIFKKPRHLAKVLKEVS